MSHATFRDTIAGNQLHMIIFRLSSGLNKKEMLILAMMLFPAISFARWPETGTEVPLNTVYSWPDTGAATYYFTIKHPSLIEGYGTTSIPVPPTGCDTAAHSVSLPRAAVCSNGNCMLQPGMTGYPSLETRTYKWTVVVSGWTWQTYHVMPDLSPWAVAIWNSNT